METQLNPVVLKPDVGGLLAKLKTNLQILDGEFAPDDTQEIIAGIFAEVAAITPEQAELLSDHELSVLRQLLLDHPKRFMTRSRDPHVNGANIYSYYHGVQATKLLPLREQLRGRQGIINGYAVDGNPLRAGRQYVNGEGPGRRELKPGEWIFKTSYTLESVDIRKDESQADDHPHNVRWVDRFEGDDKRLRLNCYAYVD